MTPEKQRLAIASVCGWHEKPEPHGSFNASAWWQNEHRYPSYEMPVPNYPEDLNAMHEAEKVLSTNPEYTQQHAFNNYAYLLIEVCKHQCSAVHATAAQRAEAFLKTLHLWEP